MKKVPEYPILTCNSQKEWDNWLKQHHQSDGVWLKFYKKSSGIVSLGYDGALDVALCYGWIDSQTKKCDEESYLQKFTPRRSKSIWSKVNTKHIERLIQAGKMKPAGIEQVEAAKKDGRWQDAYDSPATIQLPDEFLKKLAADPKAQAFYNTLSKTNTYAIAWRLQTAKKPETKTRRMETILQMLHNEKKFH